MSLNINIAGANFTKFIGLAAPYSILSGLVGLYKFGTNGGVTNLSGGSNLIVLGAPVVGVNSFVGGIANGYDTGLSDTTDFTYIAVAKRISSSAMLIGNFNSVSTDADIGSILGQAVGSAAVTAPNVNTNLGTTKAMTGVVGDVCFFAATCSGNTITVYFGNGNALISSTFTGGIRSLDSAETIKIAKHNYPGYYIADEEIYLAGVHNVGLSGSDIATVYQDLRSYYYGLGVTTTM
jgi:hypothetical protein